MSTERKSHSSVVETLQSLVVAFVLAMVFRGFVVEGFVIPTGSMAPTLLGKHLLMHSSQTGQDFPVGFDARRSTSADRFTDPLLGRNIPLSIAEVKKVLPSYGLARYNNGRRIPQRAGDRVVVLKTLFPFFNPARYDVVVFKNPTDTQGPSGNYIKRLIGLPGETLWISDGDIFAKSGDAPFTIQRKPEHIQRSLWREVSNSDAIPTDILGLSRSWAPPWNGFPADSWEFVDRTWVCNSKDPSTLVWDQNKIQIDDWLSYNMLMPTIRQEPISDIRVSATMTPELKNLAASFTLEAMGHRYVWVVAHGKAELKLSTVSGDAIKSVEIPIDGFKAGIATRMEFWHADQMMSMYIDGQRIAQLQYDFGPEERLRLATGVGPNVPIEDIAGQGGKPAKITWHFDGSPLFITRLQVDHDLYYRSAPLPSRATRNPTAPGNEKLVEIGSPAFGTHPDKLAVLGEDQFMMAGDNSAYSLDGRLWGNPDEFVAAQFDDSPFVVDRNLLIGKAWSVYWPAVNRLGPLPIIPDFGRIRFIR